MSGGLGHVVPFFKPRDLFLQPASKTLSWTPTVGPDGQRFPYGLGWFTTEYKGVPLVWQIYPQHDDAHHAKLAAFLDWLRPAADQRDFFLAWNGVRPGPLRLPAATGWAASARAALDRAQALPELAAELELFAAGRGRI